ncbi:MAG TPA: DUF692 domain-containing protein [Roseiflexaceae bacterium]|nr:DUF692 domain-containing protein [Roseiflexaceae bacterium]
MPRIGWLEAHSENYFADGGAQIDYLLQLRSHYPLSLHGVGLSIGSTDPLDREHLRKLKRLISRAEPALVSEHLSWGSVDGSFMNDLLPLPYTDEALRHMIERVTQVQDFLGRQILIENVSSYLQFKDSRLDEAAFLAALSFEADCGLLLDVNNIYVSARNHGFDPYRFIAKIPASQVQEIHLAGHTVNRDGERSILIDTHSDHVCDAVWRLYDFAVEHCGPTPTLIEWDTDIPALDVLVNEAALADAHLENARGLAA